MPLTKPATFELEQEIVSVEVTAPPSSPNDGDTHVVARGATGPFYLKDDLIATWVAGRSAWTFSKPSDGQRVQVAGTSNWIAYDAAARTWKPSVELGVAKDGLTASTTQAQGQLPLAHELNVVAVCANANDACTLPPARPGQTCVVANDGAETLQAFPAAGHTIDAGVANASTTIAAGKRRHFYAKSAAGWISLLGA